MNTINIDTDKCVGCKNCYKACFIDVIRWDEETRKPVVAFPEDCVHCNYCENNCPSKCIKVIPDWNMHWPRIV